MEIITITNLYNRQSKIYIVLLEFKNIIINMNIILYYIYTPLYTV